MTNKIKNIRALLAIMLISMLCVGMTACGSDSKGDSDNIDPDAKITYKKYEKLKKNDWNEMSPKEMEKFLGVKYIVDKKSTKEWGDGYKVVDFPGDDEDTRLHVLFKKNDEGKWHTASLSPTGKLLDKELEKD